MNNYICQIDGYKKTVTDAIIGFCEEQTYTEDEYRHKWGQRSSTATEYGYVPVVGFKLIRRILKGGGDG